MRNEGKREGWRDELRSFFDGIEREDETYADNVERRARFYADVARPALEDAGGELARYGRECETGEDDGRVYIIVRDAADKVEFQYAFVVEVRVEGLTPYVHCWYEERPDAGEEPAQEAAREGEGEKKQRSSEDDKGGGREQKGEEAVEKPEDGEKSGGGEKEGEGKEDGEDKSSGQPERTKTVEPLADWAEGRELQSVTREEIVSDFVAHYKAALARLRAPLHAART